MYDVESCKLHVMQSKSITNNNNNGSQNHLYSAFPTLVQRAGHLLLPLPS